MAIPLEVALPIDIDPNDPVGNYLRLSAYRAAHPEYDAELEAQTIGNPISLRNIGTQGRAMAKKLVDRATASVGSYVDGVKSPRRDPIQAAKASNVKFKANVQVALTEDRWLKAQDGRNLDEEITAATSDGGAAYSNGLTRRQGKIERIFNELAPEYATISQIIQAMPQDNDAQREARMTNARKMMIALGKKRRGG